MNFVGEKFAFIQVENHFSIVQGAKNRFNISFMFLYHLAENENVIEIDNTKFVDISS